MEFFCVRVVVVVFFVNRSPGATVSSYSNCPGADETENLCVQVHVSGSVQLSAHRRSLIDIQIRRIKNLFFFQTKIQ